MSDENSNLRPWIDPALEVRIVSLVLGEASDFEREELERLIAGDADLANFKKRIEATHGILEDVAEEGRGPSTAELQLPEAMRAELLATFAGEASAAADEFEDALEYPAEDSTSFPWRRTLAIAAAVAMMALIGSMMMPAYNLVDRKSVFSRPPMVASAADADAENHLFFDGATTEAVTAPAPTSLSTVALASVGPQDRARQALAAMNDYGYVPAPSAPQQDGWYAGTSSDPFGDVDADVGATLRLRPSRSPGAMEDLVREEFGEPNQDFDIAGVSTAKPDEGNAHSMFKREFRGGANDLSDFRLNEIEPRAMPGNSTPVAAPVLPQLTAQSAPPAQNQHEVAVAGRGVTPVGEAKSLSRSDLEGAEQEKSDSLMTVATSTERDAPQPLEPSPATELDLTKLDAMSVDDNFGSDAFDDSIALGFGRDMLVQENEEARRSVPLKKAQQGIDADLYATDQDGKGRFGTVRGYDSNAMARGLNKRADITLQSQNLQAELPEDWGRDRQLIEKQMTDLSRLGDLQSAGRGNSTSNRGQITPSTVEVAPVSEVAGSGGSGGGGALGGGGRSEEVAVNFTDVSGKPMAAAETPAKAAEHETYTRFRTTVDGQMAESARIGHGQVTPIEVAKSDGNDKKKKNHPQGVARTTVTATSGGTVRMSGVADSALSVSGVVEARGAAIGGVISPEGGQISVNGTGVVDAEGVVDSFGVNPTPSRLAVVNEGMIDASGGSDGGTIKIGGGFQAKDQAAAGPDVGRKLERSIEERFVQLQEAEMPQQQSESLETVTESVQMLGRVAVDQNAKTEDSLTRRKKLSELAAKVEAGKPLAMPDLALQPEAVEFEGFINYGTPIKTSGSDDVAAITHFGIGASDSEMGAAEGEGDKRVAGQTVDNFAWMSREALEQPEAPLAPAQRGLAQVEDQLGQIKELEDSMSSVSMDPFSPVPLENESLPEDASARSNAMFDSEAEAAVEQKLAKQIQITTKFVETKPSANNELGFDWLLDQPGTDSGVEPGSGKGFITADGYRESTSDQTRARMTRNVEAEWELPVNSPVTSGMRSSGEAVTDDSIDGLLAVVVPDSPAVSYESDYFWKEQIDRDWQQFGNDSNTQAGGTRWDTPRAAGDVDRRFGNYRPTDSDVDNYDALFGTPSTVRKLETLTLDSKAASVTARSGEREKVEVTREFYYPAEYEAPEIPAAYEVRAKTRAKTIVKTQAPSNLGEIATSDEAFSTFSLHVSDVSFKLAQASLEKGEWPDAERIRIEEFVNAFDYGDPLPTLDEKVDCQMEQTIHPFLQQRNLLRISMRTAAAGRSVSTPLNLTLLLDNSGSMERHDRRETVGRAFDLLAQQLQPNDQATLIGFARTPRLLADQVTSEHRQQLSQVLANTPSEGGTNLEEALHLALEKAGEQKIDGAQNRVILLTDGAANLGNADPESLASTVHAMRTEGIAFDAAGIGADGLNDEILEALTRQGDGRYYLLDRPEDADEGFARQIAGALRPAAMNVKVQIEFNPDRVSSYKLLGFEKHRLNKEDFRDDSVDAAEIAAEEAGVAVYQFEPLAGGTGDVGTAFLRFRDMSSGEMVEKRWAIPYAPEAPRPDQAEPSVRIATVAALFAARLKGDALGESVTLSELTQLLNTLPEQFSGLERVQQLGQMIEQARNLEAQ